MSLCVWYISYPEEFINGILHLNGFPSLWSLASEYYSEAVWKSDISLRYIYIYCCLSFPKYMSRYAIATEENLSVLHLAVILYKIGGKRSKYINILLN